MAAVAAAKFWLKISGLDYFKNPGRFCVCMKGTDLAKKIKRFRTHLISVF